MVGGIISSQARVEENLEKIPLQLAAMLEEGVEFLRKKYSSESTELLEELSSLQKLMESFINTKEEELGRQQELFENLLQKHKTLLKDLLDFSQKSEKTQEMLTDLEDLMKSQAKTIEELRAKLASKEETAAAAELKEPVDLKEESQTVSNPRPHYNFDNLITVISSDEEEEEEEDITESAEVREEQEESETPPSPNLLSGFGSVGNGLLMFSSSELESDSDGSLEMLEE